MSEHMNDEELPEDEIIRDRHFISNEFLTEVKGDQPVSSSMLDKIFLPLNRLPKELLAEIAGSPEIAAQMLLAERPIFRTFIEKPYWVTQEKERGFSRINVDIYGSVALADDRHLLDMVIGRGNLILEASNYTLRQVAQGISNRGLGLDDVEWDNLPNQDNIDRPLLNRGIYYHISFKELCIGMGVKNLKKTRFGILDKLRRLSIMHLQLTPVKGGVEQNNKRTAFSLVSKEIIPLLDKASVRNGQYSVDTHTDLIVNISEYYASSLERDGIISRRRLKNNYVHLTGKNNIEDFYKSAIDTNKREFMHGKYLSDCILQYYENKMGTFGVNKSFKYRQLFNQVVDDKLKIREHFNLILRKINHKNSLNKEQDYVFLYLETLKKNGDEVS
jgi:hypothetical protein